jgi:uncharacterized membrane protein YuzA (DUF378 family)
MDSITNIFTFVFGINFILVGGVALIAGIVSFTKKDGSVKTQTSITYMIAGVAAVYFGVVLLKDSF